MAMEPSGVDSSAIHRLQNRQLDGFIAAKYWNHLDGSVATA